MEINTAIDISKEQKNSLLSLLKIHLPNTKVWAYGSRVKWSAKPNSDLDLVAFTNAKQSPNIENLKEALAESNLPFSVDLLEWETIPEKFQNNIKAQYVELQSDKVEGLPSGWRVVKLGDVVDIFDAQRVPIAKAKRISGKYPYYGASGIADYINEYIFSGTFLLLSEDGDNLRTQNTPIAFLAKGKFWVNNHAHIVKADKNNLTEYICYALQVANIKSYISGSTRPKITQKDMKKIPFLLPPLPEQKAIAHILGKLDDKIELNRQINKTLETMAQTLFKSWFVNFDPVIDNAIKAGNPIPDPLKPQATKRKTTKPTLPKDLQSLFPNSFVFNETLKKWIPEGWENIKLENITDTIIDNRGKTPPHNDQEKIPLVEVNSIKGSQRFFTNNTIRKYVNLETYNSWFRGHLEKNDVLVSTVGSIGEIALIDNRKLCIAQNIIALRYKNNGIYLFELLKYNRSKIINLDISSVQPSIKVPHLLDVDILKSKETIIKYFIVMATPYSEKIGANVLESQTLTKLRDNLLPKLISGKIRIA